MPSSPTLFDKTIYEKWLYWLGVSYPSAVASKHRQLSSNGRIACIDQKKMDETK